jgi:transcriptional regulator GlxA family with amidase domain
LTERFTLSALSVFVDHLRLAADGGDQSRTLRIRWSIMSGNGRKIAASCGVLVQPDCELIPPNELDYIVIIGGVLDGHSPVANSTLRYLRAAGSTQTPLIGICTGSFVLCRAGVMSHRTTCVNWSSHAHFERAFPGQAVVADRLFLIDGPRITCAGGARAAAALATHLIRQHFGSGPAQKASHVLLFERIHSGSDLQPHPLFLQNVTDPRVRRCLLLMEQNLSQSIRIEKIAQQLGISVRQLERLCRKHVGLGPSDLYGELRMRYSTWLIENTDRQIGDISDECGYSGGSHFSKHFRRVHGHSPSEHRRVSAPSKSLDSVGTRVFP